MIDSLHFVKASVFLLACTQIICPMAQVMIRNNSSKKYEYISGNECRELCALQDTIIPLTWFMYADKKRGEANIEFYDPAENHIKERKRFGLCTFILYFSQEVMADGSARYKVLLEQKKPALLINVRKQFVTSDNLNGSQLISE